MNIEASAHFCYTGNVFFLLIVNKHKIVLDGRNICQEYHALCYTMSCLLYLHDRLQLKGKKIGHVFILAYLYVVIIFKQLFIIINEGHPRSLTNR